MNPERLRAGKAIEQTGQPPLLPGSSQDLKSTADTEESQTAPSHQGAVPSKIPEILFEDDQSSKPETALTRKFELGTTQPGPSPTEEAQKLPEAYGTGKLLLAGRDPHTLFAHWDLTSEQQRRYNSLSQDGRLVLRAYDHAFSNEPALEMPLEPESRHTFFHVKRAGTSYVGELGYYEPGRVWKTIATSGPTTVPSDAPSENTAVTFATFPQAHTTASAPATAKTAAAADLLPSIIPVPVPRWPFGPQTGEDEQLAATESKLRPSQGLLADAPPFVKRSARREWTAVQERLLAEMIRISMERREWINSAEIAELVRHEIELPEAAALPTLVNISSPAGAVPFERKGFWFNVNAELIIYGATEPNAQVTISGRPINLRPDGTFSCHFALPDGDYDLSAVALSSENEIREATMSFRRHTEYFGEIAAHAQNPLLEQIPQP